MLKAYAFPKSEVPMVSMYVWEVNAREVKKGCGIVWEAIQNKGGSGIPTAWGLGGCI